MDKPQYNTSDLKQLNHLQLLEIAATLNIPESQCFDCDKTTEAILKAQKNIKQPKRLNYDFDR